MPEARTVPVVRSVKVTVPLFTVVPVFCVSVTVAVKVTFIPSNVSGVEDDTLMLVVEAVAVVTVIDKLEIDPDGSSIE
jgi:hypothetical protein